MPPKLLSKEYVNDLRALHEHGVFTALEAGECIAIPTETVYGLAANAHDGKAVARIFEMKRRPSFNPLICHVNDLAMAEREGLFDPLSIRLAETFWPGPLTLVVRKQPDSKVHDLVTAGLPTVAMRMPDGPARAIIGEFGRPLAAPSANRSGEVSPTRSAHVADQFSDCDLLILDNGDCEVGLESTIVKIDAGKPVILRPGSVTAGMIGEVTGVQPVETSGKTVEAPGMMRSHYAPKARVVLSDAPAEGTTGYLDFGDHFEDVPGAARFELSAGRDLREAAARLYAGMRHLDGLGIDTIMVAPIPNEGLGVAINDRLGRAAAPRDDQ